MPTFRSKPRTIVAEQYRVDRANVLGVCRGGPTCETKDSLSDTAPHLHTMHSGQSVFLKDGDWVAQEPDGIHYYPIADVVMETNYYQLADEFICPNCGVPFGRELHKCGTCRLRYCIDCLDLPCRGTKHSRN